jgi:hypothetical protein
VTLETSIGNIAIKKAVSHLGTLLLVTQETFHLEISPLSRRFKEQLGHVRDHASVLDWTIQESTANHFANPKTNSLFLSRKEVVRTKDGCGDN